MLWTDTSGRTLADYPHPSLAVDVALLTVHADELCVVLHRPDEGFAAHQWALPGTFVRPEETLSEAALRSLRDKAGVTGRAPRQLHAFDALDRDERGRVISVAHVDLIPPGGAHGAPLAPIRHGQIALPDGQHALPFDHDEIVAAAAHWARARYTDRPDPQHLLGPSFTLLELRNVHAAVLGSDQTPTKDTFRRRMTPHLVETGETTSGHVGKPARVYTRA